MSLYREILVYSLLIQNFSWINRLISTKHDQRSSQLSDIYHRWPLIWFCNALRVQLSINTFCIYHQWRSTIYVWPLLHLWEMYVFWSIHIYHHSGWVICSTLPLNTMQIRAFETLSKIDDEWKATTLHLDNGTEQNSVLDRSLPPALSMNLILVLYILYPLSHSDKFLFTIVTLLSLIRGIFYGSLSFSQSSRLVWQLALEGREKLFT